MENLEGIIRRLKEFDSIKALQKKGKVYLVGGMVRDYFMDKESKDIDLLVLDIPFKDISNILSKFGKVSETEVGNKMGVIKFKPWGWKNGDIDVAIPRTETKIGDGHADFEVVPNHKLPIEEDLRRRDFTMNAIAVDMDLNFVDPFNGIQDIKDNVLKCVDPIAFVEDPLRMLRGIQFQARFGSQMDAETLILMKKHCFEIKNITKERILEELNKMCDKGVYRTKALYTGVQTGLFNNIFESRMNQEFIQEVFDAPKLPRANFYYMLIHAFCWYRNDPSNCYIELFKGDTKTAIDIKALHAFFRSIVLDSSTKGIRSAIVESYKISKEIGNGSLILPDYAKKELMYMKDNNIPFHTKDLAVNGNDLMKLGLNGPDLGIVLRALIEDAISDNVKNIFEDLIGRAKLIKASLNA